jgi:hypothetical protein
VRSERVGRPSPPPRADRSGASAPPPTLQNSEALNAPLFHSVIGALDEASRFVVLDLGRARSQTIAAFSGYRCRLEIGDIADGVDPLNTETDAKALRDKVEALLPPKRREPIDFVLCWDLLNYLTRPALALLMDSIAARGRRGMLAHCLVFYSAPHMPAKPGCWVPLDSARLSNRAPSPAVRKAPRYTPEDLGLCMPRYTVERARLLRNGMQEYLFRL